MKIFKPVQTWRKNIEQFERQIRPKNSLLQKIRYHLNLCNIFELNIISKQISRQYCKVRKLLTITYCDFTDILPEHVKSTVVLYKNLTCWGHDRGLVNKYWNEHY